MYTSFHLAKENFLYEEVERKQARKDGIKVTIVTEENQTDVAAHEKRTKTAVPRLSRR